MRQETIKLELIEWLTSLKDIDTLQYLKIIKDARADNKDWWSELTEEQRLGIQRGLKDIDEGRIVSHSDVKKKYGL
ncbi:MAG: hypothetical protein KG029_10900 [Bacteroidetes bacterium]|jgi:predicted transcriptional regulator|nr:hypothetical protein [Bacteroidota bacterium]